MSLDATLFARSCEITAIVTHCHDVCLYPVLVKDEEGCQEVVTGLSSCLTDDDSSF